MTDPEIDPATGMPVVPDGYFWRVSKHQGEYDYNPSLYVQLRQRTPHWWNKNASTKIAEIGWDLEDTTQQWTTWRGYKAYYALDADKVEEGTRNLAFMVYKEHEQRLVQEVKSQALDTKVKTIVGDYPPKKLEAV